MFRIIMKDGTELVEGRVRWADVPKEEVVKLFSDFGGQQQAITIPENATPVVFNTGECMLNTGAVEQISQSIGYDIDGQRFLITISTKGHITRRWEECQ